MRGGERENQGCGLYVFASCKPPLELRAASPRDGVKERKDIPVSVFKFQSEQNVSTD